MCTVCGCGESEVKGHDHAHHHHHHGKGEAGVSVPGLSQSRIVEIERDVLGKNDAYAATNRQRFSDQGTFVLNLVSSPGSGKTSLLVRTVEALKGKMPVAVIEGDQQTENDANRIRETGVPAIQVNTGKGCHLDAHMVGHAAEHLNMGAGALFIENVGNLVCPAGFDLGEAHKVVILSVTEGEDKPIKYPDMFAVADLMILSKSDLLPHLRFDVETCLDYARKVNPDMEILVLSSETGDGFEAWCDWIEAGVRGAV